jgi:hypothetical protein
LLSRRLVVALASVPIPVQLEDVVFLFWS